MREFGTHVQRRSWGTGPAAAAAAVVAIGTMITPLRTQAETPESASSNAAFRTSRCVECHQFQAVLTHPTGVRPTMAVPSGLPLVNGMVDCVTCHEAPASHATTFAKVGVRGGSTALCGQCHSAGEQLSHASSGMPAHLKSISTKVLGIGGMDAESRSCLSCHDGAMASAGDVRMLGLDTESTHPLGTKARQDAPSSSDTRLVDVAGVDGRVRLFGKAVGCGSCHSPYARAGRLLVMSNSKSRLCLSCHVE